MTITNLKITEPDYRWAEQLADAFWLGEQLPLPKQEFSLDQAFAIKRAMFRLIEADMSWRQLEGEEIMHHFIQPATDGHKPEEQFTSEMIGRKIGKQPAAGLIATPIYRHFYDSAELQYFLPNNFIGFEPELAVVFGNKLPDRIKNETEFYEALADANAKLTIGIEILASRFQIPANQSLAFPLILADHLHHWGYVVSEEQLAIEPTLAYHELPFEVRWGESKTNAQKITGKSSLKNKQSGNQHPLHILWQFYQTRPYNPLTEIEKCKKGEIITLGNLWHQALTLPDSSAKSCQVEFQMSGFLPLTINFQTAHRQ